MEIEQGLTWEKIRKMEADYYKMPTYPDRHKLPSSYIQDEEQTYAWNRKYVKEYNESIDQEMSKMNIARGEAWTEVEKAFPEMIFTALDHKVDKHDCAQIANYLRSKYERNNFYELTHKAEELCDLIASMDWFTQSRYDTERIPDLEEFVKENVDWKYVVEDYNKTFEMPSEPDRKILPENYEIDKTQSVRWNRQKVIENNQLYKREFRQIKENYEKAMLKNREMQLYVVCKDLDWKLTIKDADRLLSFWIEKHKKECINAQCSAFQERCEFIKGLNLFS